jgi:trimeric autotransporter adhesin
MKTKISCRLITLALLSLATIILDTAYAQGTAFTYQGRLTDGANPAGGIYDLRFTLYDNSTGGSQQGPILTNSATAVSNGLFTATLDFGNQFPGANRWLEIGVRTNGGGSFFTLSPRQAITPAPYAITAGSVVSGGLGAGTYGNAVTFNNANNSFSGAFTGNGANVSNVNAASLGGLASSNFWQLGGNNLAPGKFLGSVNNRPVEIWANSQRVMQFAYASNGLDGYSPNIIGGFAGNFATAGVIGATIIGGGSPNNGTNRVLADYGTVLGGSQNTAMGAYSIAMGFGSVASGGASTAMGDTTIASGGEATAMGELSVASGQVSTAMGYRSTASGFASMAMGSSQATNSNATALGSATAGGAYSIAAGVSYAKGDYSVALGAAEADGRYSTALGYANAVGDYSIAMGGGFSHANGFCSTAMGISGADGTNAVAMGHSRAGGDYSTSMGYSSAGGNYSTSLGNSTAEGDYSTSMGVSDASGFRSVAMGDSDAGGLYATAIGISEADGDYSFAAGTSAFAGNEGSFVWADNSTGAVFADTAANQFLIRAAGGVGIGTAAPETPLHIADLHGITLGTSATGGGYTALRIDLSAAQSGYAELQAISSAGSSFGPLILQANGGNVGIGTTTPASKLTVNGNILATGTITGSSDRNVKEHFSPVSARDVLEKVSALPISEWNYKADNETLRHIGPMAQDFYAAFNVGMDDKHISMVDADGVALAAIQGLNEKVEVRSQNAEGSIRKLEAENAELKQSVDELKAMVKQLASQK